MAWGHWFHLSGHTYGTWLPGDERGFRTRHHREHVEGDYKRPPPAGLYDGRRARARSLMTREAVYLTVEQRTRAVAEIVRSFAKWRVPLAVLSVDAVHKHALVQVADGDPRHWLGLAKKESSAYMRRDGLAPLGGLWAVRCGVTPIADEQHYANVVKYIADHVEQGAVVHLDGLPGVDPDELAV